VSPTVELERGTLDVSDEQDANEREFHECHLYDHRQWPYEEPKQAMCGLPRHLDQHSRKHSDGRAPWQQGETACSACGIPICMDCLLLANSIPRCEQ